MDYPKGMQGRNLPRLPTYKPIKIKSMKANYIVKIEQTNGEVIASAGMSARNAIEDFNLFVNEFKPECMRGLDKSVSIYKVGEDLPKRVHLFNV